jgi:hypothetical protein
MRGWLDNFSCNRWLDGRYYKHACLVVCLGSSGRCVVFLSSGAIVNKWYFYRGQVRKKNSAIKIIGKIVGD